MSSNGVLDEHELALVAELEEIQAGHGAAIKAATEAIDAEIDKARAAIRDLQAERKKALRKVNDEHKAAILEAGRRHAQGDRAARIMDAATREADLSGLAYGETTVTGAARCYLQAQADADAQREAYDKEPRPGAWRWI